MDLRDLAYFETIAELGHLGLAAEKLGRTKPALTKSVRRLEADIGAPLFQRQGRQIFLTEVGHVLHRKARQMRAAMEAAVAELGDFVSGAAGHIRIGTGPTVAEYILPDLLQRMLTELPGVTTEIMVDLGHSLRLALAENRVDFIISTILPRDSQEFVAHAYASDDVVVVASRDHPLNGRPFGLQDLLEYKWALPSRTVATRQWLDWVFTSRGLRSPEAQIETSSLQVLPTLIRRTNILGFTPRSNLGVGGVAATLVELPFDATTMRRQLGILHRRTFEMSPAMNRLLRIAESLTWSTPRE